MAVVASGKPARTDVERVAVSAGLRARCAARCTPAARTRSGSTSRARGLPLVADRALRRPAGARHGAPGAARSRARVRAPGHRRAADVSIRSRRATSLTPGRQVVAAGRRPESPGGAPAGSATIGAIPFRCERGQRREAPGRAARRDHRDVTAPEGAERNQRPAQTLPNRRVPGRRRQPRRDAAEDFTTT